MQFVRDLTTTGRTNRVWVSFSEISLLVIIVSVSTPPVPAQTLVSQCVSASAQGTSNTVSCSTTMNLAAGNTLVIFARSAVPNSASGVSLSSVSDGGDTFTLGAFCNYSSPGGLQAAWATNIAANSSATITATFSANAQYRALWAVQVSGVSASRCNRRRLQ